MSREVWFRGRAEKTKQWVEGSYCIAETLDGQDVEHHIIEYAARGESYLIEPETLGQYVNKKDCTGRKIFEGDIVDCVDDGFKNRFVVVWDESELDFKATNGKEEYGKDFMYLSCCDEIEIVGNIYDNPELMQGRQ